MSKKNDGGQAFPCMYPNADNLGMTLRDYFAAAALRGMMCAWKEQDCALLSERNQLSSAARMFAAAIDALGEDGEEFLATSCYSVADAMLAARSKPQRKDGDE